MTTFEEDLDPTYMAPKNRPHALLTAEEAAALCKKAQGGCQRSRDAMVENNLRLVTSIAKRYHARSLTFDDLVQEGIVGLLTAIQRFDPRRNCKFSTVATHWIRQAIGRALEKNDRIIRIPSHAHVVERHARKAEERLHASSGRPPSHEEIIIEAEMDANTARTYYRLVEDAISFDGVEGEETSAMEFLRDDEREGPEEAAVRSDWEERVRTYLGYLAPRERMVIEERFGFGGFPKSHAEIVPMAEGITRQAVQQTEARAIRKLRQWMKEDGFES